MHNWYTPRCMVVQLHVTYDKEGDNIQQAPAAIPGLRSNLSAIHQLLLPKTTQLQNLTATAIM